MKKGVANEIHEIKRERGTTTFSSRSILMDSYIDRPSCVISKKLW